jgi:signal transduction histidine kinase
MPRGDQAMTQETDAAGGWRAAVLDPHNAKANAVLGLAFTAVWVVGLLVALDSGWYPADPLSYAFLGLASTLAILLCRPLPLVGLILVGLASSWPDWWFDEPQIRVIPLAIAAYLSAESGLRLRAAAPIVTVFVVAVATGLPWQITLTIKYGYFEGWFVTDPSTRILAAVVVFAALLLGAMANARARTVATLRRRNDELSRLRSADAARIAAEERTAIARDIHDVVAHHLAGMVIRAQAADRVAEERPEELRETVQWIAQSGQEALTAMRQVVRVLRAGDEPVATPEFAESLAAVIDRVRGVGMDVTAEVPADLSLDRQEQEVLLRIAQESLTNVMLHSSATAVTLAITRDAAGVAMRIEDAGGPVPERLDRRGTGFGVAGMRERARSLGGSLEAGPRQGGGWRVAALLPNAASRAQGRAVVGA